MSVTVFHRIESLAFVNVEVEVERGEIQSEEIYASQVVFEMNSV